MAIGVLQSVVRLPALSGVPEDAVENVFHFGLSSADDPDVDAATAQGRIANFYNTVQASGFRIADFINESVSRVAAAATTFHYFTDDFSGQTPFGSPVLTSSWTLLGTGGGTPLPAEVAIVSSFHGDLTDVPETAPKPGGPPGAIIRPASRRRGRHYLGPWEASIGTEDANHVLRPSVNSRNTITQAADALATASTASISWSVWSRLDEAVYTVLGGYVDNAFDTQRRRGEVATTRTIWSA